ncbi:hypothetical protein PMAYCL1PPCAC_23716, partial [Pristionchus mayeri]
MQTPHHSTYISHRRPSPNNTALTDTASDVHSDLLLSPFARSSTLTPSMLNKYYEELESARHMQRLQRASTSAEMRGAMGGISLMSAPRLSTGADSRLCGNGGSGTAYAYPSSTYRGGSTGATSSPRTSPCKPFLSSLSLSPSGDGRYSAMSNSLCERGSSAASGLHQSCSRSSAVAAANAGSGGTPHAPSPPMECTMVYLADLVKEKNQLEIF